MGWTNETLFDDDGGPYVPRHECPTCGARSEQYGYCSSACEQRGKEEAEVARQAALAAEAVRLKEFEGLSRCREDDFREIEVITDYDRGLTKVMLVAQFLRKNPEARYAQYRRYATPCLGVQARSEGAVSPLVEEEARVKREEAAARAAAEKSFRALPLLGKGRYFWAVNGQPTAAYEGLRSDGDAVVRWVGRLETVGTVSRKVVFTSVTLRRGRVRTEARDGQRVLKPVYGWNPPIGTPVAVVPTSGSYGEVEVKPVQDTK